MAGQEFSKLEEIAKKVADSKLIESCIDVAFSLGNVKEQAHDYYTSYYCKFRYNELKIYYTDGVGGEYSDGFFQIDMGNENVFRVLIRNSLPDANLPVIRIEGRNYQIKKYISGNWEEKVIEISRNKEQIKKEGAEEAKKEYERVMSDFKKRIAG